jgi:hypothetical protein
VSTSDPTAIFRTGIRPAARTRFSLRQCGYALRKVESFSKEVVAVCYSYREYREEQEARKRREEELRRQREEQAQQTEKKEPARRERVLVRS